MKMIKMIINSNSGCGHSFFTVKSTDETDSLFWCVHWKAQLSPFTSDPSNPPSLSRSLLRSLAVTAPKSHRVRGRVARPGWPALAAHADRGGGSNGRCTGPRSGPSAVSAPCSWPRPPAQLLRLDRPPGLPWKRGGGGGGVMEGRLQRSDDPCSDVE